MSEHKSISIADQIFEQLERDILTGKYQRGELLSETRLASELGVSRTPIREAIRRLEQEHILDESSRGAVVVGISKDDMYDMYEIRIQLEGIAAERAASHISDDELNKMREILDLQRYYIEKSGADGTDNSDQIKNLDSQFHALLYMSCGSKAYRDTLLPMHKKMTKFRKASVRKNSRAIESLSEHEAIYSALAKRDGKLAAELTTQHVINARDSIMNMEV